MILPLYGEGMDKSIPSYSIIILELLPELIGSGKQ